MLIHAALPSIQSHVLLGTVGATPRWPGIQCRLQTPTPQLSVHFERLRVASIHREEIYCGTSRNNGTAPRPGYSVYTRFSSRYSLLAYARLLYGNKRLAPKRGLRVAALPRRFRSRYCCVLASGLQGCAITTIWVDLGGGSWTEMHDPAKRNHNQIFLKQCGCQLRSRVPNLTPCRLISQVLMQTKVELLKLKNTTSCHENKWRERHSFSDFVLFRFAASGNLKCHVTTPPLLRAI